MSGIKEILLFIVFFPIIVSAAVASIPMTIFCGMPAAILWTIICD